MPTQETCKTGARKFTYPNRIIIPNVHCLGLPGKLRMMNLMQSTYVSSTVGLVLLQDRILAVQEYGGREMGTNDFQCFPRERNFTLHRR